MKKSSSKNSLFINIIVFILIIVNIFIFNNSVNSQKEEIFIEADNANKELQNTIQYGITAIEYLKTVTLELFKNKDDNKINYAQKIHSIDDKGNYALDIKGIANLTGYDGLKSDKEIVKEMELSVELTEYFKTVKELNSNYAWVYYISKHKFYTMYPYVPSNEFCWYPENAAMPLLEEALPENNPKGELFITPLYFDGVGLGLMATIGNPIYYKNEFMGTVDLDITLKSQSELLKRLNQNDGTYFIINKENQIIGADNAKGFNNKKIFTIDNFIEDSILKMDDTINSLELNNGKYIYIKQYSNAPWKIIYYKKQSDILIQAFLMTIPLFILILILLNMKKLFTKLEDSNKIIEKAHKQTRDSIKFASLIQSAILPQQEILDNYTTDNFTKWQPKDIVGGDIYFVVELESKEEVLVMVIDGAGHGVPGAFVTMLVKAIETQIVARIKEGSLSPSPAEILAYFNKSIKTMLKQEKGSKSNAGFDGGILYYNKTTKECKYAGAKTDLYIIDDNKLNIISGDKKNVGFVRTKIDQKYTEHTVTLKKDTKLYLSTDGVFDQEGKNKSRYGLDKFENFLVEMNNEPFEKQSEMIMKSFNNFKKDINQTDDVTVIGLNFK